jgi:hypothetical protein
LKISKNKSTLTENSCESEIAKLDDPVLRDEDVFRLDVPVDAVVKVAVVDGLQRLPDQAHRRRHRNSDKQKEKQKKFN